MPEQWRDPFMVWAAQDAQQLWDRAQRARAAAEQRRARRLDCGSATSTDLDDDTRAKLRGLLGYPGAM